MTNPKRRPAMEACEECDGSGRSMTDGVLPVVRTCLSCVGGWVPLRLTDAALYEIAEAGYEYVRGVIDREDYAEALSDAGLLAPEGESDE